MGALRPRPHTLPSVRAGHQQSKLRAGCAWKTRSTSRSCGASTRSPIKRASRSCSGLQRRPAAKPRLKRGRQRPRRRSRRPRTSVSVRRPVLGPRESLQEPRARRRPPRAYEGAHRTCESGTATQRARAEKEVALPHLRFNRDRRGYETTALVQSSRRRGRGQQRILYWFRTPPGVRVGRAAIDEDAIHLLEQHNPDVQFDWTRILKQPMTSEVQPWEPERPAARPRQEPPRSASSSGRHTRSPSPPPPPPSAPPAEMDVTESVSPEQLASQDVDPDGSGARHGSPAGT